MLAPATDADHQFLQALYASTRADELATAPWPEEAKATFLAGQYALQHRHFAAHHPAGDYWLIVRRGERIGRLYLDRTGPVWRITDIALLPAARGGRIGGRLLRWLQHAAAMAAVDLDLHVARDNPRAALLYTRLGFVEAVTAHPTHRRLIWRRPGAGRP